MTPVILVCQTLLLRTRCLDPLLDLASVVPCLSQSLLPHLVVPDHQGVALAKEFPVSQIQERCLVVDLAAESPIPIVILSTAAVRLWFWLYLWVV